MASASSTKNRLAGLYLLMILGTTAACLFIGIFLLDWSHFSPSHGARPGPLDQFFNFDPDTAQNALGNLAQVITAILGIVITVVSIVVQLAATRYTPRIAEMFFRDRANLIILGFFVVAGIDAVWVSLSVTREFIPRYSIAGALVMVTFSVLVMVPYFAYVFDFLDPEKVVARIQEQALASTITKKKGEDVELRQVRVLQSVEQLNDVAMNAVSQKDKLIAQGAVDAMKELLTHYLSSKSGAEAAWFSLGNKLRQNPDYVSMAKESVDGLEDNKIWLEWKVLRAYQAIYNYSLGNMPDMNYLLAIDTRYIGEAAISVGDRPVLGLAVKYFNTFLRATLNATQVRTGYNVLNQYRQLCEKIIVAGGDLNDLAVEVAGYFRYYGQVAHGMKIGFLMETIGYDLATLCERAFVIGSPCHDQLLRVFLTLDQQAETGSDQERMLRGVRKAQAKLATFYLVSGAEQHARLIAADMADEPAPRLRSIRDELLAIATSDFWEVIDRGTNFDYLNPDRKEKLRIFFSWFRALDEPALAATT